LPALRSVLAHARSRGSEIHPGACRATTTISPLATQGAWLISVEKLCSFQAAILQTLWRSFRGKGSIGERRVAVAVSGCLTLWFAAIDSIVSARFSRFTFCDFQYTLNDSNDAPPSPCRVTLVGFSFADLSRIHQGKASLGIVSARQSRR
jgi:hypothetical protein